VCLWGITTSLPALDVVQFAGNPYYSVAEDQEGVEIRVERTGTLADYCEVTFKALVKGSAGTADFDPASRVLTFEPGQSNLAAKVEIRNDALVEGNETFEVRLSDPDPFSCELGVNTNAVRTIEDNDRGVEFATSYLQLQETGGKVEVTIQRGGDVLSQEGSVRIVQ
jgi:hypothetical protein